MRLGCRGPGTEGSSRRNDPGPPLWVAPVLLKSCPRQQCWSQLWLPDVRKQENGGRGNRQPPPAGGPRVLWSDSCSVKGGGQHAKTMGEGGVAIHNHSHLNEHLLCS